MIICLKRISEECFSFNVNVSANLKLLWALEELSEGTQAREHSEGTQAREHSEGTQAREHSEGIQAREHSEGT